LQQGSRDLDVVDALEEAEKADGFFMKLDVLAIDDRRNATDRFVTTPREEILDLRVLVERMFTTIEELFLVEEQWRHPTGIVLVNPPRQREKLFQISATMNRDNAHCHWHALPSLGRFQSRP